MGKGNEPAFPVDRADGESGLTKREYFAVLIVQGTMSIPDSLEHRKMSLSMAVELADALIEELAKEK